MKKSNRLNNKLRIIGGRWRGRKILFESAKELRPTKDMVRETLFSWIGQYINGARCLDLFCGSGSLGIEALSRGARYCDFVDSNSSCTKSLILNLRALSTANFAKVYTEEVNQFLSSCSNCYDVVFIDPPFNSKLLNQTCKVLWSSHFVTLGGLIYVEFSASSPVNTFPSNWSLCREKQSGEVKYRLYSRSQD